MANAQNIDRIFAELAKKVQREVQINLPRKVGIIAKNHFTDNFRKGGFVDSSLEPWQTTKRQQSGRGARRRAGYVLLGGNDANEMLWHI